RRGEAGRSDGSRCASNDGSSIVRILVGIERGPWMRPGLTILALCAGVTAAWAQMPLEYDRDVRPILSENCFPCHGQDSKKRMAGLRLDSFAGATADRGGHAALVPGKPEASAVYQRITAQQTARRMPPASSNRHLNPDQ